MEFRKLYTAIEETFGEMGRVADEPLRKVAAIAVVKNPFAGKGYIEDLGDLTEASIDIGRRISAMAVDAMGPYSVDSYGKAALIGSLGEQEHGVAMLTTVYGNTMREAVGGGKAWISSFTKRASPGRNSSNAQPSGPVLFQAEPAEHAHQLLVGHDEQRRIGLDVVLN